MKEVYVLFSNQGWDLCIEGIFSTEKKANEAKEKMQANNKKLHFFVDRKEVE